MNYVIKAVENNQSTVEKKVKIQVFTRVLVIGFLLVSPIMYCYFKFCKKIPTLNETQQGLLYNILSKKINEKDMFHDVKVLDAKTKDEKAVKNFIVTLSQRTTNDNLFQDHIKEFKKFTHLSWTPFKELINLNISQSDGNNIYDSMSKIGLMYNSSVDLQQFVKNVKINIIKNILGDKFALFQKLAKENETLFSFILEYWKEK